MPDVPVLRRRVLVPALSLLLAFPAAASAAPLSGARGLTVFSAGDATVTGNENEGSMALAGDLVLPAGGDYRVGNNNVSPYVIDGKPYSCTWAGRCASRAGA